MSIHLGENAPDFIMIGAAKVGSTSIYEYLRDHPAVCLSQAKELYYFLPTEARENLKPWGAIATPEEYAAQFAHCRPGQIKVELSTNYYAYPEAASLIKAACPHVKLLMVLRDPASRAFSSYNMRLRNVGDVRPVAEELTDDQSEFVQRGFYFAQLSAFLQHFSLDEIKVFFFEDFLANKQIFYQNLCDFLEIEFIEQQRNYHGRPGGVPQQRWLHQLVSQQNPLRSAIATLLKLFLNEERRQQIRENILRSNIKKVKLSPELRRQLIQKYTDDITQLEKLLGRDLSHWKQV